MSAPNDIMSVCLAVVRGVITPEDARHAILARTTPEPLADTLRIDPSLAREAQELARLPGPEREKCLELFKELWDSTPVEEILKEDLELGKMLVGQHLVSQAQVDDCRAIQERLSRAGCRPLPRLGELLVRKGILVLGSEEQKATIKLPSGSLEPREPVLRKRSAEGYPPAVKRALADSANLFGRYVRVDRVGEGGAGEVWRGWDTDLERWVAIKFLKLEDAQELARLKREAQTAARLSHPNIAAVFEIAETPERTFLVMEFVEGQTLESYPRNDSRKLVSLFRDICLAIHYAHEQGVIHRDIKPSNIMIDPGGRAFIMDFGLARQLDQERSMSGYVLGTPSYMSPEQAMGGEVDRRSDIYSLGATLYQLLSGRPPFRGKTPLETLDRVIREDPPPLTATSEDLRTIVSKCLMKEPGRRYQTAKELGEDLRHWEAGEAILAHPPSVLYLWQKRIARRRGVIGVGLAGILLAAGIAGVVIPRWLRADRGIALKERELAEERKSREREEQALEAARLHLGEARKFRTLLDRMLATETASTEAIQGVAAQALKEYDLALLARPNDPDALLEQGWVYQISKDRFRALECCEKAIHASAGFTTAYLTRARILLDQLERARQAWGGETSRLPAELAGLIPRILRDLAEVEARSKDALERLFVSGARAFTEGDSERAARSLEEYSKKSGSDYRAWEWTSHAWLRVPGMEEKAIQAISEALKYRSRQPSLWLVRAQAHLLKAERASEKKDWGEEKAERGSAQADFRRALELDPSDERAERGLGEALRPPGETASARTLFWNVVQGESSTPSALLVRAWARLRRLDADGAISDADEALARGASRAPALTVRARARIVELDLGGSQSDLESVLSVDPSSPSALLALGDLKRERGDPLGAIGDYGRAIDWDPGLAEAYHHRGNAQRERGDLERALEDLALALAIDPGNSLVLFDRAVTRCNQGSWARAESDLREGLSVDPARPERIALRLWLVRAKQVGPLAARQELGVLPGKKGATGSVLGMIGELLAGTLPESEFLAWLKKAELTRRALAEAYFYAGENALMGGRADPAEELLKKCLRTSVVSSPGCSTAAIELRALASPR